MIIETLPERKSLNGKFSAYCEVCWLAVYILWIDDEPHNGACINGHTRAEKCPHALAAARNTATTRKLKKAGVVR